MIYRGRDKEVIKMSKHKHKKEKSLSLKDTLELIIKAMVAAAALITALAEAFK